jgi:hypothetical protein
VDEPKTVLSKGAAKSVGGKLDGIKNQEKMYNQTLFGKNGWAK